MVSLSYLPRLAEEKIKKVARHFKVILVVGARQVGKSTLLRHLFPRVPCVVFDPIQDIHRARQDPDLFLESFPSPIILDEIQFVPELLSSIKRKVDLEQRPGQYFLTGSQNLAVLKTVSESLAGRVGILRLDGMTQKEFAGAGKKMKGFIQTYLEDPEFSQGISSLDCISKERLNRVLWKGSFPAVRDLSNDLLPTFFESYVQTYVERDIRIMGDIKDLSDFGRFLAMTAALTAQEINSSQFGRDAGISPATARRWLDLLTGTFQWFELPPFHGNALKRISGKRKGHFVDSGLLCSLQRISSPESLSVNPLLGSIFESWVVNEIRRQFITLDVSPNMYHWRTSGGGEVDLLLERDGTLFPIEIKCKSHLSSHDTRGIRAFRETYPKRKIAPGLVINAGSGGSRINQMAFGVPWSALCPET
ncbi:hypothetical protein AUK22_05345 [bacterium CG2_30_54_10]|nr:MAG: hypothetical protein AUK22_05345 [bacterium CG2_30_54_10]